jgi:hypothetical protein
LGWRRFPRVYIVLVASRWNLLGRNTAQESTFAERVSLGCHSDMVIGAHLERFGASEFLVRSKIRPINGGISSEEHFWRICWFPRF